MIEIINTGKTKPITRNIDKQQRVTFPKEMLQNADKVQIYWLENGIFIQTIK